MHLLVNTADEHIEEKHWGKYLTITSTDEKKEVLKNVQNFGMKLNTWLKQ